MAGAMKPHRPPKSVWARVRRMRRRLQVWAKRHLPPGVRLLVGLLLMVGGIFAFLPVLGIWMIPVGIAVAALDVVPLWRRLRRRERRR